MEEEMTKSEALRQLSAEFAERAEKIRKKYEHIKCGRDGGETQELKELDKELELRFREIMMKYENKHLD